MEAFRLIFSWVAAILGILALVSYIGILGFGLYIVVVGVFFAWWEGR